MEKITYLLIILLNFNANSQNNFRVKYDLKFQIDSTNSKNIEKEIMILDIKNNLSNFQSENNFLKDSIFASNNPNGIFGLSKTKFNYNIKKEYSNSKIISYYDYTGFKYLINEDLIIKWKIIDDSTKIILNQKCKLASTNFRGRSYYAWYSTEINIQDGPYKFYGLPGIILEIYDVKKHYHFLAIAIQKNKINKQYIDENAFTKVTKKEFNEFLIKIKEKPSLILYNPGIQLPKEGLDKYDNKHRELNKRKNNPIELTD